jgi:hypothetical protein
MSSTDTKEILVKTIREWVKIDNELRTLKKEQKIRDTEKKRLSANLIKIMKEKEIDCFDINDGKIQYNKQTVKKPITKQLLLNILSKYYQGDETKAGEVQNFILENREETVKETITRKINNTDN